MHASRYVLLAAEAACCGVSHDPSCSAAPVVHEIYVEAPPDSDMGSLCGLSGMLCGLGVRIVMKVGSLCRCTMFGMLTACIVVGVFSGTECEGYRVRLCWLCYQRRVRGCGRVAGIVAWRDAGLSSYPPPAHSCRVQEAASHGCFRCRAHTSPTCTRYYAECTRGKWRRCSHRHWEQRCRCREGADWEQINIHLDSH